MSARRLVSRARRQLGWRAWRGWGWLGERLRGEVQIPSGVDERVRFRCNLCGTDCDVPPSAIGREARSCERCGSIVRWRAIVHLLTTELFGRSITLPELPVRKDIAGLGLSDALCYSDDLARRFAYLNTFFDRKPRLDIAEVDPGRAAEYDFIISSDVFEHVAPPVIQAFRNARRLLKRDGFLILTVPYTLELDTIEHFPSLRDYRIEKTDGGWLLENRTVDGKREVFTDLVFHGGAGSTLEMRRFALAGLERELTAAGFSRLRVAHEAFPAHGIYWKEPFGLPMVAYA